MAGPNETRLARAVASMNTCEVNVSGQEWGIGARRLAALAEALRGAGPAMQRSFGGRTGDQARDAFERVAAKAEQRAEEMEAAGRALAEASTEGSKAMRTYHDLGPEPSQPSPVESQPGMNDADQIRAQQAHSRQVGAYNDAMAAREARAEAALRDMDRTYEQSTEVMKRIHGEPDQDSAGSAGGGAGGGGAGAPPAGGGGAPGPRAPGGTTPPNLPHAPSSGPGDGPGGPPGGPPTLTSPPAALTPTPGGATLPPAAHPGLTAPALGSPVAPTGFDPVAPIGGSVGGGATGGIGSMAGLGALGGAGALGALGASGALGGVRGGAAVAPGTNTRSSGRPIGAGRAAGAGGVLGRGGQAAGGRGAGARGAGAAAGAGAGRSSSASKGSSSKGSSSKGSAAKGGVRSGGTAAGRAAGRPGARSGAGAAAGGTGARANGKSERERRSRDDIFDTEKDWVDDEGVAPGVID